MNNYNHPHQKRNKPQKRNAYIRRNTKNEAQLRRYQYQSGKYDKLKEKIFTDNTPPRRVTHPFPVYDSHTNETAQIINAFTNKSTPPKNKAQPRKKAAAAIDFNPGDYDREAAQFARYPHAHKPFISNYKQYPNARQNRYSSASYTKRVPRGPPPPGFNNTINARAAAATRPNMNANNIAFYECVPRAPEARQMTQLEPQRAPIANYRAESVPIYAWKQKTQSQKQLETQQKFDQLTKHMHSEKEKGDVLVQLTIEDIVRRKEAKKEMRLQQEMQRRKQIELEEQQRKLQQLLNEQQMTQSALAQIVQSLDFHTMQYKQAEITGNATSMKVLLIQIQQDKQLHKQGVDKLSAVMQQIAVIEHGHEVNQVQIDNNEYVQKEVLSINKQQQRENMNKNKPKRRLPQMQPKPHNNKQSVAEWKTNMDVNMYRRPPRYY